jgi:ELWxxDGT repeat protein
MIKASSIARSSLPLLLAFPVQAQQPHAELLNDFFPGTSATSDASPRYMMPFGDRALFMRVDEAIGYEPWFTDGTADGTGPLADLLPGREDSSAAQDVIEFSDRFYFRSSRYYEDVYELWVTDGTSAGTRMITERPFLGWFQKVDDTLFFWSDNTMNRVQGDTIDPVPLPNGVRFFSSTAALPGKLFCVTKDSSYEGRLWVVDPATLQSTQISPFGVICSYIWPRIAYNGAIYFVAKKSGVGEELWRSDGTSAGTVLLKDINPGAGSSSISRFERAGERFAFLANNGTNGLELWSSLGTADTTSMVLDILPYHRANSRPSLLGGSETGHAFFTAEDDLNGAFLWATDGTTEGTRTVRYISSTSALYAAAVINGKAWFSFNTDGKGHEPWVSDGTPEGTFLLKDIVAGSGSSGPRYFTALGDRVLFIADSKLWQTDGTPGGTGLLLPELLQSAPNSSIPAQDAARDLLADDLLFEVRTGATTAAVAITDGNTTGTRLLPVTSSTGVTDISSIAAGADYALVPLKLSGYSMHELWRADSSTTGTFMLAPMYSYEDDLLQPFFHNDHFLLPWGPGNTTNVELWRSEGTAETTQLLADINEYYSASPSSFCAYDGRVFFSADGGGTIGRELYATDGTAPGTTLIADLWTANGYYANYGSNPAELTVVGDILFFSAEDQDVGRELFRTDGTTAGTRLVEDTNPVPLTPTPTPPPTYFPTYKAQLLGAGGLPTDSSNPRLLTSFDGALLYFANSSPAWRGLWRSDGTPEGTYYLTTSSPTGSSEHEAIAVSGSTVYFAADDGVHGWELWKTNGSDEGTTMVLDIVPGSRGSVPESFFPYEGGVFFSAGTPQNGHELWYSDGTPEGKRLYRELSPGAAASHPEVYAIMGGKLVVAATDFRVHGRELWLVDLPPAPPER